MAKTGVDANERNCGPAHLRQSAFLHSDARFAGRVGRIPVPNKGMRDENRLANLVPKIMASNEIQPIACDALLCAGLAFGGYAKPVLEQVLRSIRKLAAEPTETVGWLRAWAVCAPARHKPPRGPPGPPGSGLRSDLCFALTARDARYFIMKIDTQPRLQHPWFKFQIDHQQKATFKPVLNLHF
jgi:hypothetical protein